MTEFWESSFIDKQEMWGSEPADSAIFALELFKKYKLNKILIPGFGYGRNAKIFTDNGFKVTGIEISKTAIDIWEKKSGDDITVYHGSVSSMPFDNELYDGIFCYALLHLLSTEERIKLINDCYNQLRPGGYMVFITISKKDARYGEGKEIFKDTFETKHGVTLFFSDTDSVQKEFGNNGLIEVDEISEESKDDKNRVSQKFLQIICRKDN